MKMKAKIYQAPKTSVSGIVMIDIVRTRMNYQKVCGLAQSAAQLMSMHFFIRSPELHRWTFSYLFSFLNLCLL